MDGEDQKRTRESRSSPRVVVRFPVKFFGRNVEGTAYARNVSVSGALLEEAEPLLITGGQIRLRFALAPDALPIDISAEVVRETEGGFTVRFTRMDSRVRSVLKTVISKMLRAVEQEGEDPDDDEDKTLLTV